MYIFIVEYCSIDTTSADNGVTYQPDTLNSLELTGLPAHRLELKVGAPVMVMRNLDPPTVCNGTRMVVKKMHRNIVECTLLTGAKAGTVVYIPRIPLEPSDFPIKFKRLQFPLRLSFSMSINKAQACF